MSLDFDFSDLIELMDDNPFEETPVDLDTFLGPQYLNQPPLSPIQRDMVEKMSQIYRESDLIKLMGFEEGKRHFNEHTKKEVILALGKGSGKDHTSTIGCAYLVYKLRCLKDPAAYFGKPPGDAIDIINIAINAQQARNVFFKRFKQMIEKSPWFAGKFDPKMDVVEFIKGVTVYSGHSERESHEGLNLILAVLDEISGFQQVSNTGNDLAKTSDAIYNAFRGTVDSRFPTFGKVILLSFPRYKGDFISKRYEDVIGLKETIMRDHTFVIHPDLPEDDPNNRFRIEWEEDHIVSYKLPGFYALKAPTWEVNPLMDIEDLKTAFLQNPGDALQRFACMGLSYSDAFFKNIDLLKDSMIVRNPIDGFNRVDAGWEPNPNITYFVHADLAQKQDRAAVAVAHVKRWVKVGQFMDYEQMVPEVIVDMVAYWEPKHDNPIDLKAVKDWIVNLRRQGMHLGLVTFDRWNSLDIQMELNSLGIKTETLSVALKHYDDLAMLVYERRVKMPAIDILFDELSELRIVSDKQVDHPRKGSKDLADATAGAVYNAITRTPKDFFGTVDIHDLDTVKLGVRGQEVPDKPEITNEIKDWLDRMAAL